MLLADSMLARLDAGEVVTVDEELLPSTIRHLMRRDPRLQVTLAVSGGTVALSRITLPAEVVPCGRSS